MPTIWQFRLEGTCSSGWDSRHQQRPAQVLVLTEERLWVSARFVELRGAWGHLGRTFNGSRGTKTWGTLGTGTGIERSGEGLYAERKRGPLGFYQARE